MSDKQVESVLAASQRISNLVDALTAEGYESGTLAIALIDANVRLARSRAPDRSTADILRDLVRITSNMAEAEVSAEEEK